MEIIATRDILSGEEVTIDYGENWERPWEAHVQSWEAPINDGTYVPVRAMIESNDLRTSDELESNPYPDNVQLVCLFWESEFEGTRKRMMRGVKKKPHQARTGYQKTESMQNIRRPPHGGGGKHDFKAGAEATKEREKGETKKKGEKKKGKDSSNSNSFSRFVYYGMEFFLGCLYISLCDINNIWVHPLQYFRAVVFLRVSYGVEFHVEV
jgi:hypothetical protein